MVATRVVKSYTHCGLLVVMLGLMSRVPGIETLINRLAVAVIRSRFPTAPRRYLEGLVRKMECVQLSRSTPACWTLTCRCP